MENLRVYSISDPERFAFYEKNHRGLIAQLLAVGHKSPTVCYRFDIENGDMFIPQEIKNKECQLIFVVDFYHGDPPYETDNYREIYFDCENVRYCLGHKISESTKWPEKNMLEEKMYEGVLDYELGDFIGQFTHFTIEEISIKAKATFAVRLINQFKIKALRKSETLVIRSL